MMRSASILIAIATAISIVALGCVGEDAIADQAASTCPDGLKPFTEFNLYFGLERGDGSEVTAEEWEAFLAEVVTPRFPDGLTVFDARGQWLDTEAGRLYREGTRVLNVLVPAGDTADAMVSLSEIADLYVERFDQQVVFRTSSEACAGF